MSTPSWPVRAVFWLLLPLSLLQGLRLRRTATRLPEAPGPRSSAVGRGRTLRLLALGDSIIAGVGLDSTAASLPVQFARALSRHHPLRVRWRLEGSNGATVHELPARLPHIDAGSAPDVVLISVGVNDVTALTPLKRWQAGLGHLLDDLRKRWPAACIVVLGLPDMAHFPLLRGPLRLTMGWRAAALDAIAKKAIEGRHGMYHLASRIGPFRHGFCPDGFHPDAEACKLWATEMSQHLEQQRGFQHCMAAAAGRET